MLGEFDKDCWLTYTWHDDYDCPDSCGDFSLTQLKDILPEHIYEKLLLNDEVDEDGYHITCY